DAVRRNASGGSIGRYKNEIHGLNLPALAREAKANLDSGAAARAEGFSAAESRAAFSMQFLALTNPAAVREETIGRENQETMQCEVVGTRRRLKTRREQARDTILQKKNDALTQMRRTKTELQRSIREAAAKGAAGLRKQGRQVEHDLLSNRIPMADAWRQRMLKLRHTFGPGRFFDLRRYWKGVEGGPLQLQKLRMEQEKAVRKQASDAIDGLTNNRREQSRGLWDMAREATKEFPEVQLATSDDIREIQIHFTEAMRGECSNAEDEAAVHQRISQRRQRDQYPAQVKAAMYSALLKTPPQPPAGVTAGAAPDPANTIEGNFDTQIQNFKNEAIRLRDNFDREARAPGGAYEQLDADVDRRLERGTRELEGGINHTVLGFSATDEDRIYNAFNDLSSRGCKALTAYYDAHHSTSLVSEFYSEFEDQDELNAALHLAWGERELAQEYLASSSKHWYGDNHDRARNSVRQLSDDELANLRAMPGWAGRRASIVDGLGSRDASIVGAYLDGDRNRAIGLQIDERMTRARREGEDAIIDGTAELDRMVAEDRAIALRDRVRPVSAEEEERGLETMRQGTVRELAVASGALRREELRDLTQEQVADRLAAHLTRDRETQQGGGGRHGHHGGVRIPVSDQAKGAVQDMLRHGSNSPTARGARLAYEAHRGQTTGMSETRQERILAVGEDPELKSAREAMTRAENSHSPAAIEAARRRLERAQANHSTFLQSYARRSNGPPEARTDPAAAERHAISSLSPLFEGVHSRYGGEFVRTMIRDGRPSLLSAYMLATDKSGTHETMLDNAFANRSPEELRELRQRYATEVARRPNDLQAFDRDYRSELSGDDRHRFEHALLTESGTDLNLIEHGLLGAGQNYEGIGGGGRYAMAGSDQERQLLDTRNQLIDTVAAVSGLPRERVIGPDGRLTDEARRLAFTDPPEERLRIATDPVTHRPTAAGVAQWQQFRTSSIQLRGVSDRYKDGVDRAEERLLAVFQIIGAIATAALMIVFPASIVLIGVLSAAIMGAATMVTKQVMRGGRYGWEEAVEDLASTGIDMAAAFVGGRMAGKAIQQGLRGANAVRAAVQRGLVTGALSGAGHAAIRDSTWKDGITTGLGRVLGEGAKQAAMNAATEGVSTWGGERLEGMFKRAPAGGARPDAEVHAPGGARPDAEVHAPGGAHEGAPGPRPDAEVHGPGGAHEGGPAARPDAEVHGPAGAHEGASAPRGPAAGGAEGAPAGPRPATPELEGGEWNRFGRLLGPNGRAIVNEVLSNAGGVLAGDVAGVFADIVSGHPPHSLAEFAENTGANQLRELIGAAARGRANARNMRLKD
ncbi:MAG TPA: hypothetical protein PLA94_08340, partial [Myxococcota bacterium]|nr:hypothetical protein [Myxococcota bacterium]